MEACSSCCRGSGASACSSSDGSTRSDAGRASSPPSLRRSCRLLPDGEAGVEAGCAAANASLAVSQIFEALVCTSEEPDADASGCTSCSRRQPFSPVSGCSAGAPASSEARAMLSAGLAARLVSHCADSSANAACMASADAAGVGFAGGAPWPPSPVILAAATPATKVMDWTRTKRVSAVTCGGTRRRQTHQCCQRLAHASYLSQLHGAELHRQRVPFCCRAWREAAQRVSPRKSHAPGAAQQEQCAQRTLAALFQASSGPAGAAGAAPGEHAGPGAPVAASRRRLLV